MHEPADAFLTECRRAFRHCYRLPLPEQHGTEAGVGNDRDLLERARRHRVAGLLYAGGSPATRAICRRIAYGQAQLAAQHMAEAERLFTLAEPRLHKLALFKGPALAQQAWPEPGCRAFDDLDFRCARPDFAALQETMRCAGYQPVDTNETRRSHSWHFGWGNTFLHPDGYRVEFNHRFFAPHYVRPAVLRVDNQEFYGMDSFDTREIRTPLPPFHLLLACLHLFWHGGQRLAWVVDIAGLLARHPGALDLAETWAGNAGLPRRALHTGCRVADRLFGPDLISRDLPQTGGSAVRTLIHQLQRGQPPTMRDQRGLHRQLLSMRGFLSYTVRRACIPGDGDLSRLVLPPRLRPLYWLYRPLRIAGGKTKGKK